MLEIALPKAGLLTPFENKRVENPIMGTFANSSDPDEKAQYVAFHQGLHCLSRQNRSSVHLRPMEFCIKLHTIKSGLSMVYIEGSHVIIYQNILNLSSSTFVCY